MIYNPYHFSTKKKEKIVSMRFLPNIVTVYSKDKVEFDYKHNHGRSKSDNFRLDSIKKNQLKNTSSYVIYFIRVGVKKDPTGQERLQVVYLIAMTIELVVISYQYTDFFHNMSSKAYD